MALERRVDKRDPRDAAAIREFAPPAAWKSKRSSLYISLLSTIR